MASSVIEIIENPVSITVDNSNVDVIVNEQTVTIDIGVSGPQGADGTVDPTDLGYVYTQGVAATTWNITHGLSFIPNITVIDSGGTVIEGSYNYPDENTVVLTFSNAFSGKAYLS